MVSIIIVNWNTGRLLARCLKALSGLPERNLISEVWVIDNASRDESVKLARDIEGDLLISYELLKENVGFARANNLAWRRVNRENHVLLLNPDTEMRPGSLRALVDELERDTRAGIVGPRLVNADGTWQPSTRQLPTVMVLAGMFLKLHRLWPRAGWWRRYVMSDFKGNARREVDQVMGAVFMVRNSLWNRLGQLDERFYLWFEEVDYCARARKAGWKVIYTPAGEVLHYGAASFDQLIGVVKAWPFIRSALVYARIHLGWTGCVLLAVMAPIALTLAAPASLFHVWRRKKYRLNR